MSAGEQMQQQQQHRPRYHYSFYSSLLFFVAAALHFRYPQARCAVCGRWWVMPALLATLATTSSLHHSRGYSDTPEEHDDLMQRVDRCVACFVLGVFGLLHRDYFEAYCFLLMGLAVYDSVNHTDVPEDKSLRHAAMHGMAFTGIVYMMTN